MIVCYESKRNSQNVRGFCAEMNGRASDQFHQ